MTSIADAEPWRSMTEADALAYLVERDVERRGNTPSMQLHTMGLTGIRNRKKLVAWRAANRLCKKCGRAIPANEQFIHCPRCRERMRDEKSRQWRRMTHEKREAHNTKARRWYHEQVAEAEVEDLGETQRKIDEAVTKAFEANPQQHDLEDAIADAEGMVTPMVTHDDEVVTATTAKRDRAEYMRAYRAAKRAEAE